MASNGGPGMNLADLRDQPKLISQNLEKEKTLSKIEQSIAHHTYSVDSLGCAGLRHFIYKSRQHVQVTMPEWPEHYKADGQDRKRSVLFPIYFLDPTTLVLECRHPGLIIMLKV